MWPHWPTSVSLRGRGAGHALRRDIFRVPTRPSGQPRVLQSDFVEITQYAAGDGIETRQDRLALRSPVKVVGLLCPTKPVLLA
jgi:hypothetical protein